MLPPFRHFEKDNFAVVVKKVAGLQSGCVMMSLFLAWLVWVLIYIQFVAQGSLRFSVFFQWIWTYLSAKCGCLEPHLTASLRHQLNMNM
jgi:NADH:ubiquinone reductase (H+-translocating)